MVTEKRHIHVGGQDGIAPMCIGDGALLVIAGPCVIESHKRTVHIARSLRDVCARVGLPFVFKASLVDRNTTAKFGSQEWPRKGHK